MPERALSLYTMQRAYWESRFYDQDYWARYLDLLARNRFNSLVVIFGYENGGFLAPCYPYFFDVEQFPDVRMVGITGAEQQRNLDALNRLIEMTHARGLNFTVGIWDHIYRGGVQGGGISGAEHVPAKPTSGLVWDVTEQNLTAYTLAALGKFLRLVPKLDAIQFRMHDESGLKKGEQEAFWQNVFQIVKQQAPHVRFDARAKGLPDSVIDAGLEAEVNLRITTKYWMEQMGLPFHPTHINRQNQFDRRHSYADLLRYPQRYNMHWRLWNGGTTRVLLWGDPEYARRFADSTHLYQGQGFEVNEPLFRHREAAANGLPCSGCWPEEGQFKGVGRIGAAGPRISRPCECDGRHARLRICNTGGTSIGFDSLTGCRNAKNNMSSASDGAHPTARSAKVAGQVRFPATTLSERHPSRNAAHTATA